MRVLPVILFLLAIPACVEPGEPVEESVHYMLFVHGGISHRLVGFDPDDKAGITQRFYIGKHEVTNDQYAQFVRETGYDGKDHPSTKDSFLGHFVDGAPPESKGDHPVCNLNWYHASAYCEWLSKKTGLVFRLPAKNEWRYAARGKTGREFPWGDEWDATRCNSVGNQDGFLESAPVGSFPSGNTPEGVQDMAGNIWEWCEDRVLRGGPWCAGPELLATSKDASEDVDRADDKFGFRLVHVPSD